MISFSRLLQPLKSKIFLMIARSILEEVDNTGKTMRIKAECLKNESLSDIERMEEYGFTSYPPLDDKTENIILFPNGNRDFGLSIVSHNPDARPTSLVEGESMVYGKDSGSTFTNYIKISPTNDTITIETKDSIKIELTTDGTKQVNIDGADKINLLGATEAFLNGTTFDSWLTSFTTWASTHTHPTAPVGPVSPPTTPPPSGPTGHLSTKIKGE